MTPATRGNPVMQDRTLDALIEELLRVREQDPPLSDEAIRAIRAQGRP
jgi:hypothetical protein